MEKINSFVFYRSFFEATKGLKPLERLTVFEAIFDYVFEEKQPKLNGVPSIILTMAIPNLDAAIANWNNGKKGGRPKKQTPVKRGVSDGVSNGGLKGGLKGEVETDKDIDSDVDSDVDKDDYLPFTDELPKPAKAKKSKSSPKSEEEIFTLCKERYPDLDVEKEFRKMKNWCEDNGKPLNQRRATNWLNKALDAVAEKKRAEQDKLDAWFAEGPSNETLGKWEEEAQREEARNASVNFGNNKRNT